MTTIDRIGLAGDWHGQQNWMREALHTFGEEGIKCVFHLGDFALGWPGKWPMLADVAESVCKQYDMELHIVPGNHENWNWINTREFNEYRSHKMTEHTFILGRNAVMNVGGRKILALGGAPSIDYDTRTKNIDWWSEEMILLREAEEAARMEDVDIMLCHDSPDGGTPAVQRIIDIPWNESFFSRKGLQYAWEGRQLMNLAVYGDGTDDLPGARPKVFAHGHFHVDDVSQDEDTLWLSLSCNGFVNNMGILDLKTFDFKFLNFSGRGGR